MQAPPPAHEDLLPEIRTAVPGPESVALAERLRAVESRNVTCLDPVAPIFWQRASGANVWDADGNRFVDLTGAFGVASAGHAHPDVTGAIAEQAATLLHGMGDVHPAEAKVELLEALAARFPGGGPAKAVLGSSGSDAVEVAIKTALLDDARPGLVAFEGGYHGLSFGALDATFRADFREPFANRLPGATAFAPYGDAEGAGRAAHALQHRGFPVGAIIVEPVQGRGGEIVPPAGFLRDLRRLCDDEGWLLIADEIYTGCGRTGRFFACEHEDVVPDLLCVGKGLSSGMPISACVGRAAVMDVWPASTGEALHTQTFLGHPAGCAAALASLRVIEREGLTDRAAKLGADTLARLREELEDAPSVVEVRGLGLMIGIACASGEVAASVTRAALERGVILLPSGPDGETVSITPPLTIGEAAFDHALAVLVEILTTCAVDLP